MHVCSDDWRIRVDRVEAVCEARGVWQILSGMPLGDRDDLERAATARGCRDAFVTRLQSEQ